MFGGSYILDMFYFHNSCSMLSAVVFTLIKSKRIISLVESSKKKLVVYLQEWPGLSLLPSPQTWTPSPSIVCPMSLAKIPFFCFLYASLMTGIRQQDCIL